MTIDDSPIDDSCFPITVHTAERGAGLRVVTASGELDLATSVVLRDALSAEPAGSLRHLVVDLAGVTFLGSSGISVLVEARERAHRAGHDLHLTGVAGNRAVAGPLRLTGLSTYFDVQGSTDDVVASLAAAE